MQFSGIPSKFALPWGKNAASGTIRTIPAASQIGITAGAASLNDGFPPVTLLPVEAGGTPPFAQDMNGILNQITAWSQWQQAGGPVTYDATFQTAIGGYPVGSVVASATTFGVSWLNTVDGNATNPDTGGAGWVKTKGLGPYAATDTGTANALAISVPAISALAVGQLFEVKKSAAANTGAATINVNGLGAVSVVWPDGTALASGQWGASVTALVEYDGTQFNVLSVMGPTVFAFKTSFAPTYVGSTQSITVPPGATRARARGWGAGGGGGGTYNSNSGGQCGGGGGYFDDFVTGLVPGSSITCTIGAAGAAGGNSSSPTAGSNGGATSFGAWASAGGGTGGNPSNGTLASGSAPGGAATITAGSWVAASGSSGGLPYKSYDGSAVYIIGGSGGGSPFGGSSIDPAVGAGSITGHTGNFPGGGGGGGVWGGAGGPGANGLIIVEFFP